MNVAAELIVAAKGVGIRFQPQGDRLRIQAKCEPPRELLVKLVKHKAALLAALKSPALAPEIEAAYARLHRQLAQYPGQRFASETLPETGGEQVLMAVAVKGAGYAVLRMPRARYSENKLLEMVHRWNTTEATP